MEGADSVALLRLVATMVAEAGWRLVNADCVLVLERPFISAHREPMERRLAEAAGGPVSLKGRRAEGLGALGRAEGIACWSVALLEQGGA